MSQQITTFRAVIELWPTKAALIADVNRHKGDMTLPPGVRNWHHLDRIPPRWFDALLRAAAERGFDEVTYRLLTEIHKRTSAE